jgi:Family of unknown function (DUF5343)
MSEGQNETKRVAAPYISYQTLKTFVAPLKEHVTPNRIDKSLLKSFSGAVQSQLMTALRFLRLTHEDGRPTDSLKALINAYGTDRWADALGMVLKASYPELFKLQLQSASPSEFNEAFKKAYPCEGDTLRKGVTFFLNAGREAGISFSPFLLANAKPRSGPTKRRARQNGSKEDKSRETNGGGRTDEPPPPPAGSAKALEYQLIDLMSEPDIDDPVKQSIWSLVQYLTARKAKAGK